MHRLPDHRLIALAREGVPQAADALFDRYWEHAWKAAYALTADRTLADDAAQDAVEDAFGALDRFDVTRPFGPWLKRIAVNRAIDGLRRARRLDLAREQTAALVAWPELEGAGEEGVLAVTEAVAALETPRRTVVVLRYWLDLPLDEIAGVLGLPVGTVASRLGRAMAELRVALGERNV